MTLEDYYNKRRALQLQEATELVKLYRERYEKIQMIVSYMNFFGYFMTVKILYRKDGNRCCGVLEIMKKVNAN